jgi:DNA primase
MADLYNVLMERMEGRSYSNYFACFCPFDSHKSPALIVHDDGLFVCLSCGKKGNLQYLDKFTGSHFIPQRNDTVSRVLPRWRNWEAKYGSLEGIADAAHQSLLRNNPYQTYFKRRKIYEFVEDGCLGFLDGWLVFPVYSRSKTIVDIVVRSSNRKNDIRYVVHPSGDNLRPLYVPSWNKVESSQIIYVVYGIIDAISLHLAGLPSLTGITGKSLSAELLRPLGKRFVIIPDAGEEPDARKLANKLGWRASVKQLKYDEDCKDPDMVRRVYGNEYLLNAIGV